MYQLLNTNSRYWFQLLSNRSKLLKYTCFKKLKYVNCNESEFVEYF